MNIEKILDRLVQIGVVTDTSPAKRMARVKFHDTGITSDWLRVLQHYGAEIYIEPDAQHTHDISDTYTGGGSAGTYQVHDHTPGSYLAGWMPKVHDVVLVLYLPVNNSDGYIIGGV